MSGLGLPIFDGAEPLLSGRQCQSILPGGSPLSTPPAAGLFCPCSPSTHLQGLHPQPLSPHLCPCSLRIGAVKVWLLIFQMKQASLFLSSFFCTRCDGCRRTTRLPGSRVSLRAERGDTAGTHSRWVPAHLQLCTRAVFLPTDKRCLASPGRLTAGWERNINTSLLNSLLVFIACGWQRVRWLWQTRLQLIFKEALKRTRFKAKDQAAYLPDPGMLGTHAAGLEHGPSSPHRPSRLSFGVLCPQAPPVLHRL